MNDISGDTKFNALLPLDELLCINFMSRLYRGVGYVGRALTKFYVFQVLWYLDENNCFIPVATLKAKNFGFFQENEKGVFTFQAGRVAWTRDKFTTTWKPDLYKNYEFRLGFNLRFFHFGIGYLYRDNSLLC